MTPEAGYFLAKAHRLLNEADGTLSIDLKEAAGRSAYLAEFHAAQAVISEKTGNMAKTHKGVQHELHRLTKADPNRDPKLRVFLSQAYNLKTIADYESGPGSDITPERASEAIKTPKRFVAYCENLLSASCD